MSKQAIIALDEGSMTSGTADNIIEISAEAAIGFTLPANHILWDCGQYPVAIGDTWTDGVFTRGGEPLVPVPTDAEKIAELEELTTAQDESIIALYEENLTQSETIASNDASIVTLYELLLQGGETA